MVPPVAYTYALLVSIVAAPAGIVECLFTSDPLAPVSDSQLVTVPDTSIVTVAAPVPVALPVVIMDKISKVVVTPRDPDSQDVEVSVAPDPELVPFDEVFPSDEVVSNEEVPSEEEVPSAEVASAEDEVI